MAEMSREYKDRLFCFIFGSEEHKDWTLSLYNAVNGTAYTNPEDIVIATLTQVVYMGMHNDVAFLILDEVNLYEQQSSFNPNMPLRLMQYTANIYEKLITIWQKNKYGKTLIMLPVPKLVVFYNGPTEEPDEMMLHLSDAFPADRREDADISVRVRMININTGRSPRVVGACKPLDEYTWLVDEIRRREKYMLLESAVDAALDAMPMDFLIRPFLEANRVEVKKMLLTEYNESRTMELVRKEGLQEGLEKGEQLGLRKGEQLGLRKGTVYGENKLGALISKLISLDRTGDVERAASDPVYRDQLYKEFQMVNVQL